MIRRRAGLCTGAPFPEREGAFYVNARFRGGEGGMTSVGRRPPIMRSRGPRMFGNGWFSV